MFKRLFYWIGALLLAGCVPQAVSTPTAIPTLELVPVQVSTATRFLSQSLHDCAVVDPSTGLVLEEVPAQALKPQGGKLAFRFGTPGQLPGFLAEIRHSEVKIITHPSNSLIKISVDDLRTIYNGQARSWQEVQDSPTILIAEQIHAWTYLEGDDQRDVFETWLGEKAGRGIYQAPTGVAMLEAVGKDPSAIGYVLKDWMSEGVKELEVLGDSRGLTQPVLVMAEQEPQGAARRLVACMQSMMSSQ